MALALLVSVALLSTCAIAPYQLDFAQAWSWHPNRYQSQSPTSTPSPTATPTPTPTPTPSPTPSPTANPLGNNLAGINNGWWYTDDTWTNIPAANGATIENIVYTTTFGYEGSSSFEMIPNGIQNCGVDAQPNNSGPIALVPGETVTMSCAIYTTGSSSQGYGAQIGMDFYGAQGRIGQANSPTDVANEKEGAAETAYEVQYGTNTWTVTTWTFVVPPDYTSDGGGPYASGTLVPITACIPWCAASYNVASAPYWYAGVPSGATAYFSDFQFYIK